MQEWIRRITDAWAACSGAVFTKPIVNGQPLETRQQQQQHHAVHEPAAGQQSAPPERTTLEHEYKATNLTQQSMPPLPSEDDVAEGSRRSVHVSYRYGKMAYAAWVHAACLQLITTMMVLALLADCTAMSCSSSAVTCCVCPADIVYRQQRAAA